MDPDPHSSNFVDPHHCTLDNVALKDLNSMVQEYPEKGMTSGMHWNILIIIHNTHGTCSNFFTTFPTFKVLDAFKASLLAQVYVKNNLLSLVHAFLAICKLMKIVLFKVGSGSV